MAAPFSLSPVVLDTTGYDLWPLVETACIDNGVDAVLLLACCQAESGLNPNAIRRGVWPDVSGGLTQVTVATAAGYMLGDGTAEPANIERVLTALCDRVTALDIGARILTGCVQVAADYPDPMLGALVVFNAGWLPPPGDAWWTRWAGNVVSYQRALDWARSVV